MKADRFKIYFDMYYNSELPAILERETETEKKRLKEKIIELILNNDLETEVQKNSVIEQINNMK